MRRCVILLWILAVLTVPVLALDVLEEERQILNVDTLTDGLPDDAQDASYFAASARIASFSRVSSCAIRSIYVPHAAATRAAADT